MYNRLEEARGHYERLSDEEKANACVACRQCEDLRPQHIAISGRMALVHEVLGEGQRYELCLMP